MIGLGVNFVAWGKPWHHFFEVSKMLEEDSNYDFKSYKPANFSETKFANHAAQVYCKFREVYPALVITLEEVKEEFFNGTSTEREKAEKADAVQGGILNYLFVLSLSLCSDVYTLYGKISNCLQIINILPHERMERFDQLIKVLKEMRSSIRMEDCPCFMFVDFEGSCELVEEIGVGGEIESVKGLVAELCVWPSLHGDTREVLGKGKYRGVVLGQLRQDVARTRAGSQVTKEWLGEDRTSVVERVSRRAEDMVTFLLDGLSSKVYSEEQRILVDNTRRLLDLRSSAAKLKIHGAAHVSNLGWLGLKEAVLSVEDGIFERVTEEEMRLQYREFNRRLKALTEEKNFENCDSLEILAKFLDPKMNLCK